MIKKYIDNYIINIIKDETEFIHRIIDNNYNVLSEKINNEKLLFGKDFRDMIDDIKKEIDQKDQRITDLIEQTKNQIIEKMVSTEIKSKGKIKEISKQEIISMIFRRNPQELFSPKQIHETLGCNKKHEKGYVSLLLQNLIKKGLIKKVKHGLYQYDKGW